MDNEHPDLRVIEAALADPDMLTPEQRDLLRRDKALITDPLLHRTREAFRRGEDEVAMVLARALVEKHDPDKFASRRGCVIYCRVSTEWQTKGSGLWRQLDTCLKFAQANRYAVDAVFSEVASGVDPLPVRETAERVAKRRNCKILCEDYTRWSRKGLADMPPANVIMTSEMLAELDNELRGLFRMPRIEAPKQLM